MECDLLYSYFPTWMPLATYYYYKDLHFSCNNRVLDLQFYVYVLQIDVCPLVLFLLAIVLSVLFRFMESDYPFGILKLFLHFLCKQAKTFEH